MNPSLVKGSIICCKNNRQYLTKTLTHLLIIHFPSCWLLFVSRMRSEKHHKYFRQCYFLIHRCTALLVGGFSNANMNGGSSTTIADKYSPDSDQSTSLLITSEPSTSLSQTSRKYNSLNSSGLPPIHEDNQEPQSICGNEIATLSTAFYWKKWQRCYRVNGFYSIL